MLQVYRDGIKLWVRYESVGRDGYRDDYTCFIHIHKQIYFLSEPSLSGAYLNKTKSFIYLRISYLLVYLNKSALNSLNMVFDRLLYMHVIYMYMHVYTYTHLYKTGSVFFGAKPPLEVTLSVRMWMLDQRLSLLGALGLTNAHMCRKYYCFACLYILRIKTYLKE